MTIRTALARLRKYAGRSNMFNRFEQIVAFAKFAFAFSVLGWGVGAVLYEDERAGAFYFLSLLYALYLVWGHGFKAGEREGKWKRKLDNDKT